MREMILGLLCILMIFSSCKEEAVKPSGILNAERVAQDLNAKNISKIFVYQWKSNGYVGISGKVDFKVESGYLVFPDLGNMTSYMNFDKLVTYRLSDTYAELYFGL